MSFPPGGRYGSRGQNPFDIPAQSAIHSARARVDPSYAYPGQFPPPRLTQEEREDAQKAVAQNACTLCAGIHPMPNTPGCPRLATFKVDGDGKVVEGSFFPGTNWAKGRVVLIEDAHEEDSDDADER